MSEQIQILGSSKAMGGFERPLIDILSSHFRSLGYHALSHIRLNLSWAAIVSDIDVLLLKDGTVTVVEVKSKHDKITRAHNQLSVIHDYVDFAYVATERLPKVLLDDSFGVLLIQGTNVKCVKEAKRQTDEPDKSSFFALQKKCLLRLLGIEGGRSYVSKFEAAHQASGLDSPISDRRIWLKQISTCSRLCDIDCPIWKFPKRPPKLSASSES